MEVSFFPLGYEHIDLAVHLAPEDELLKLALPEYNAIMAVTGDEMAPVGILIYSERHDGLYVEWLDIYEGYRFNNIGSKLLTKIYELAMERNYPGIRIILSGEKNTEKNINAVKEYCEDRGFLRSYESDGDYEFRIDELLDSVLFKKNYDIDGVVSLSKISQRLIRELLEKLSRAKTISDEYVKKILEYCDKEISMAHVDANGKVDGIFAVARLGDNVSPMLLRANSRNIALYLLYVTVATIKPTDAKRFICHVLFKDSSKAVLTKLFPGIQPQQAFVFEADTDYYENEKSLFKDI